MRLISTFLFCSCLLGTVILGHCAREAFRDDFNTLTAWTSNCPDSPAAVQTSVEDYPKGMEWNIPPVIPRVYWIQRELPILIDDAYEISFWINVTEPMPLEIQLGASDGSQRLYYLFELQETGWQRLSIPVSDMRVYAGFTSLDLGSRLMIRFWVDGNPTWAGNSLPRGKDLKVAFTGLEVVSTLTDLPQDIDGLLQVHPEQTVRKIPRNIYGQFLEHIFHSVENGLFGELVQNRAFTPIQGFVAVDDVLQQLSGQTDQKVVGGDPTWTDYEYTLKARKLGGSEGFLIIFRAEDESNFFWANLGGWGNVRHGFEMEVRDTRREIGISKPGRIETDHWYDIKIRVQGTKLECFLDGELILEANSVVHPSGGVGVGTWGTQAEFKDMKVTALNGANLPLDLAANLNKTTAPQYWSPWPAPEAQTLGMYQDATSPNTGWVARLELDSTTGRTGMVQEDFNIVAGHEYIGSIWAASEGDVKQAQVALLGNKGEVIASAPVSPGTKDYVETKFTLKAEQTAEEAMLLISAEGDGELLVDFVSLMRDDSVETGCRADLLEAVRGLKAPIIRWPGGCFASIYRWKKAIGTPQQRQPFFNSPWGEWDSAGFGIDEFVRLCREVDAEPLVVLNLGSWDADSKEEEYLQEALDWIEYCNGSADTPMGKLRAENGHPEPYNITNWELDNETWGMGHEKYAQRVIKFADAIRGKFSGLKLYACSFFEPEDPMLLEAIGSRIDYLSYHFYEDPANYRTAPDMYGQIWNRYTELIENSSNPSIKLAVTEWNAQSTDWRTGLFAGGFLNVMERSEAVEMASPALFLRRVDAVDWDNAFINHNNKSWFPAPNYVVMKLYADHFQPTLVDLQIHGALNANATLSEDGKTIVLKVVNPTEYALTCGINLGKDFVPVTGKAWVVSGGLTERNTIASPNRIAAQESEITLTGDLRFEFAPLSVSVLEFTR